MQLYPASVTKIMTLLLVSEAITEGKLSFDETLVCSDTAAAKGGSQIWLEPGEEMTVRDLLKAAAVYSANDACTLLGEAVAGSEETFVQMMNSRAAELGMENTHFDNCTGLDDDTTTHLTTAYDVARMSRALLKVDFIRGYTTIWMDTLRGGKTQLVNTNKLIRYYSGITGLKTGTTSKAGCCVSATAERDGLGLVAVVLGADNSNDRFNGARALLDYGFANYEIFTPSFDPASVTPVKVNHGEECSVALQAALSGDILLSRGAGAKITQQTEYAEETDAPVEKGQVLGTLRFFAGDALVAQYDLTAASDVPKLSFLKAIQRIFRSLDRGWTEKNEKKPIFFLK
jgi:D-alanyl-D-alanine carboxypeptidase (penicillin-binding protein 5/6)